MGVITRCGKKSNQPEFDEFISNKQKMHGIKKKKKEGSILIHND